VQLKDLKEEILLETKTRPEPRPLRGVKEGDDGIRKELFVTLYDIRLIMRQIEDLELEPKSSPIVDQMKSRIKSAYAAMDAATNVPEGEYRDALGKAAVEFVSSLKDAVGEARDQLQEYGITPWTEDPFDMDPDALGAG